MTDQSDRNEYAPDQGSPPGETIRAMLENDGHDAKDVVLVLAGLISSYPRAVRLLVGAEELTSELAKTLAEQLGSTEDFWLLREKQYRENKARLEKEGPKPDQVLAKRIVDFMNQLMEVDPVAVAALLEFRVPCNTALAEHPTVQVVAADAAGPNRVGLLGILNGLVGVNEAGWGLLCARMRKKTGKLEGFELARPLEYSPQAIAKTSPAEQVAKLHALLAKGGDPILATMSVDVDGPIFSAKGNVTDEFLDAVQDEGTTLVLESAEQSILTELNENAKLDIDKLVLPPEEKP